jgi:carboxymethylenebutenolidase
LKTHFTINAADGSIPASLYKSDKPRSQKGGVLFFMDAMGPRPSMDVMAQRLADDGYLVLLPDLFYRFGPYGPFNGSSFGHEESRNQIIKMMRGTTQAMTVQDAGSFIDVLRKEGIDGAIGVVGYCMGGARALTVAAKYPDDVAAVASFHGGNLASEAPDSPHLLADEIKAQVYIGAAGIDDSFPPEQSTRLADTFRKAELDFSIENYVGMKHGWTVPDRDGVFDEKGAERHWRRLLQLFGETVGRQ